MLVSEMNLSKEILKYISFLLLTFLIQRAHSHQVYFNFRFFVVFFLN